MWVLPTAAMAQQVILTPSADTRLSAAFFPDMNFGTDYISAFADNENIEHSLIKFDYASLAGSMVLSATLRLSGFSAFGSTAITTTEIYRPTRDWAEMQATWNVASTGTPWTTPGGDYVGTTGTQGTDPFSTLTGPMFPFPTTRDFDVSALVIGQTNGTWDNFGMLLSGVDPNYWQWASREAGDPENRPQLILRTQPVPEPASIVVLLGLSGYLLRRTRRR